MLTHASGHATLRQRQGDGAVGHQARRPRARPAARCCSDSTGDADRTDARDGATADQASRSRRRRDARAHLRKLLELADQEALSKGITTFVDAGSPLATIDVMKQMVDEGALGVRLWVMIRAAERRHRPEAGAVPHDRLRRRAAHRARNQEADRRRARIARRVDARSRTPTSPDSTGLNTDAGRRNRRDRAARDRERLSSCASTRSATAPTARRSTSSSAPSWPIRQEGSALAHRARAASQRRRTFRASASSASSRRCRASTARRTRRTCSRGSARSAPRKAPTSGRS